MRYRYGFKLLGHTAAANDSSLRGFAGELTAPQALDSLSKGAILVDLRSEVSDLPRDEKRLSLWSDVHLAARGGCLNCQSYRIFAALSWSPTLIL